MLVGCSLNIKLVEYKILLHVEIALILWNYLFTYSIHSGSASLTSSSIWIVYTTSPEMIRLQHLDDSFHHQNLQILNRTI